MRAALRTAGLEVELACEHRRIARVLAEGTGGQLAVAGPAGDEPGGGRAEPDVRVSVEACAEPFGTRGWEVLTRDAWWRPGEVIVRNACSSGLDLHVAAITTTLQVTARWRPPAADRAAAALLRARSRLLVRAVLLQYPALWWSQRRGRVPLHASACTVGGPDGPVALLAGPGGVGKSTLVSAELAAGGSSTSDNVCVTDGRSAWGVLEPRRVAAGAAHGHGRRMPHGRREAAWAERADCQVPDLVVVLRRSADAAPSVAPCDPGKAARSLVTGTYMAGELRRYWAFAATLALGTGTGDAHPAIGAAAARLSAGVPCAEIVLAGRPGATLASLLPAAIGRKVRT